MVASRLPDARVPCADFDCGQIVLYLISAVIVMSVGLWHGSLASEFGTEVTKPRDVAAAPCSHARQKGRPSFTNHV
jgi:hypothetical protein